MHNEKNNLIIVHLFNQSLTFCFVFKFVCVCFTFTLNLLIKFVSAQINNESSASVKNGALRLDVANTIYNLDYREMQ